MASEDIGVREQNAICVIAGNTISIFSTDGKDYLTRLPFPVSPDLVCSKYDPLLLTPH